MLSVLEPFPAFSFHLLLSSSVLLEQLKPSCSHSTHLLQNAILYPAKIWCTWLKAVQSPQLRVATTSHGFTDLMYSSHPPQTGAKTPPVWAGSDNSASQRSAGTPQLPIIHILYSTGSDTSFCQIRPQQLLISLKSILLFLHSLISSTKSSPFPSCPQVQQCSQHCISPVPDLNHLPLPPCPFFKLCFFPQYQLWCLSFTGVNTEAKANFILRHSNICRLHISSHPAIHLQTICANTLLQIHAAVVTYGESAASPADVHSELPQHELQTAWRNCSTNSFRPRTTDWKRLLLNVTTE